MRSRTMMVQSGPFVFNAEITDSGNHKYYFTGSYSKSDDFKNAIRNWYAENIDAADAYNLKFTRVTNAGEIDGLDKSQFIEV